MSLDPLVASAGFWSGSSMMRMKTHIRAAAWLLLAACTRAAAPEMPAGEPYARGPIVSITHSATASGILVGAGGSSESCGIAATADEQTRYLTRTGAGPAREVSRAELAVGDTVEVYVDGPVALSCPPQGHASTIVRVGKGPAS
jgi:hypothetical protein